MFSRNEFSKIFEGLKMVCFLEPQYLSTNKYFKQVVFFCTKVTSCTKLTLILGTVDVNCDISKIASSAEHELTFT